MFLVVDVGNTNITFGVYEDKRLVTTFRLMSKTPRTSDEYGMMLPPGAIFEKVKAVVDSTIR